MARVVCVHGIGQQHVGESQLYASWRPALADGLARAAAPPLDAADVTCVFYGDLFRPPGRTLGALDPPGGQAYATAGRRQLVVAGVHDGVVHSRVELPSVCTGLTTGPHGELAVATRSGVILLDVPTESSPDTRP
ncbi:hypothetical protein ABZV77_19325 [Streptomyces sp. NPDC004732]|uniref:hypothetical protein n=1 Tax=Streptomyces sp. NPDC004732 TaxID=3154290 RepID=UPI0033A6BC81